MGCRRFYLALAHIAMAICLAVCVRAEDDYSGCSEFDPCPNHPFSLCCVVNGKGECINNKTSVCVECANSQRTICPQGQSCCTGVGDCYSPSVSQCCGFQGLPFVCHANDSCCGGDCCGFGMACTHDLACVEYPAEPKCGMPCRDDDHCAAGGGDCGTCVQFYKSPYNNPVSKICVSNVNIPPNTDGPQSVTAQPGVTYYLSYTADPTQASVVEFASESDYEYCAFSGLSSGNMVGIYGKLNSTIYVNVLGAAIGAGGVTEGADFSQSNCQLTATYQSSTSAFPTQSLNVASSDSWSGSATKGQLLTFQLNSGDSIDGLQSPFQLSVSSSDGVNCDVLATPSIGDGPSGNMAWANEITNLSSPITLYGGPFSAEWVELLVVQSASCNLAVSATPVISQDFTNTFSFDQSIASSYVACDSEGITQCNGFTVFGQGPSGTDYCLSVTTSCSVTVNGQSGYAYGVIIEAGKPARVDIYSPGTYNSFSSCSGEISSTPGDCSTANGKESVNIV